MFSLQYSCKEHSLAIVNYCYRFLDFIIVLQNYTCILMIFMQRVKLRGAMARRAYKDSLWLCGGSCNWRRDDDDGDDDNDKDNKFVKRGRALM